jgi:hypothetical protein
MTPISCACSRAEERKQDGGSSAAAGSFFCFRAKMAMRDSRLRRSSRTRMEARRPAARREVEHPHDVAVREASLRASPRDGNEARSAHLHLTSASGAERESEQRRPR